MAEFICLSCKEPFKRRKDVKSWKRDYCCAEHRMKHRRQLRDRRYYLKLRDKRYSEIRKRLVKEG